MEQKLCIHCKHRQRDLYWKIIGLFDKTVYEFDKCTRPFGKNLVSGEDIAPPRKYCVIERTDYAYLDVCGPEGKYWECK